MSFIQMNNIVKNFGDLEVLKNLDFSADLGEFVTLLGPSGCGKSTLLRILSGLETANSGSIHINDVDMTNKDPMKREIGMVFQNYSLFPNMNSRKNISFGLSMQKVPKKEIKERVDEIISLVQLEGKEDAYPSQLSGGQQQRVALARCLVTRPKVLLLDEPLSALDAKIRKGLRFELKAIQQKLGITTVMVTHDQEEAMIMSDKVCVMDGGDIVQRGTPFEIYKAPKNRFVAGFIGNYNILSSEVMRKVIPEFDHKNCNCFAIRPEAFHEHDFDGAIHIESLVDNISLVGNIIQYRLIINNETIIGERLNRVNEFNVPKGSKIDLFIDPAEIVCFE